MQNPMAADSAAKPTSPLEEIAQLRARLAFLEQDVQPNQLSASLSNGLHEQRYRTLADVMPQLVWATDSNGSHIYYNRRWYEYTGLSEADSLGFGFTNALHPDDLERTLAMWQSAWKDGEKYEIEYRFRRHDGVYQWFVGRAQPVYDSNGAIVEWVGTCTNIEEQKRNATAQAFLAEAGQLLAESLNYEATLAHIAQLIVPHLADWFAVDISTPEGSVRRVAVAHVDPSKVQLAHELQQRIPYDPNGPTGVPAVIRTGQPELMADIPESLIREAISDPELLDIFLSLGLRSSMVVPLKVHGRTLGAITMVAAESQRQFDANDLALAEELARRAASAIENAELYQDLSESEQRYRSLADAMPLVVWTADPQGHVTYFNQQWITYTGLSLESSVGWNWEVVIHPDDFPRCAEQWATSIRTGQLYEIEYRLRRHDGEYLWFLGRAVPVRDEDGEISFWVGSGTAIDDQKRNEAAMRRRAVELARITRKLETRNQELDHFAYVTSHDLKAPLRGIANLAQWIEEDLGEHATADIQQQLSLLRGRVLRMEALIDGILQYSRVGRVKSAVEQVDVEALLDEVIDLQAPPPGFTITIAPGMPTLTTERLPLQQVFTNLIGNAIKHHNRTDGTITIDVADADQFYEFRVSDDGPGIAPEYHERIFVIFQTLAPRDKVEGSGLGLSLVKKIVETYGGTITVESAEGAGTSFRFTWPKQLETDDAPATPSA